MSDNITHRNSSCCNFYHTHAGYGSPKQKVPTRESEICCLRLVIETVVDGKKFTAQILESKNDDLNNFPGMALDGRRLPKGSKTIKLSWFAITFGSTAGKYHCPPRSPFQPFANKDGQISFVSSRSIINWNSFERKIQLP